MMDALMKRKANIRAIAYESSLKSWMMEKDWKSRMMAVISIREVIYTIVTTISEKRISGMLELFRKKR